MYNFLYNLIRNEANNYTRVAERLYNAAPGIYDCRPVSNRGVSYNIVTTYDETLREIVYVLSGTMNIPREQMLVWIGWHCSLDVSGTSFVQLKKNSAVKHEIPTQLIYNQPNHIYIDRERFVMFHQNERMEYVCVSNSHLIENLVFPLFLQIAPQVVLNSQRIISMPTTSQVNKKDVKYPHKCFQCGAKLQYTHALKKARQENFTTEQFDTIWESAEVEFYCCTCYNALISPVEDFVDY